MTMSWPRISFVAIALVWTAGQILAADAASEKTVDFSRDVFPLLQRACLECHGADRQEADLRLDLRESVIDNGYVIAGAPEDSELLRRVALPKSDPEVMPPRGEPLSPAEQQLLQRWIEQGANWPDHVDVRPHWAYVGPVQSPLPDVSDPQWPRNGIDRFVLAHLDAANVSPSPAAAPEILIRRLYLDLIGLPPSPQEVDAFLQNPSDAAYEQLVDELLARPQFGERWARPWLDYARYADSHGFQRDNLRDLWAYRDWVIQAINADMPFDQFTIEQLAGDLLPNPTDSQRIATGFNRCSPTNIEAGSLPEETRIAQVIDRVNTTASVWLGATLECAQCHDHKYDPFSQKEYFQLLAYFNSTAMEADLSKPDVPSSIDFLGPSLDLDNPERNRQREEVLAQIQDVRSRQSLRRKQLDGELDQWAQAQASMLANEPEGFPLEVAQFRSQGTTDTFEILDDGSVLMTGLDVPDEDFYEIRIRAPRPELAAIRLQALMDPSLPGNGPGRGDGQRPNFVLNEFKAFLHSSGSSSAELIAEESLTPLPFQSATCNFSQEDWPVAHAIDGDARTGWAIAPRFGESHWAVFELQEPLRLGDDDEIVIRMTQSFGSGRTIGRVRLTGYAASPGNAFAESSTGGLAPEVAAILKKQPQEWTEPERKTLLDQCAEQDPASKDLQQERTQLERSRVALKPETTLVMVELETPRMSTVFQRGDYKQPGEPVTPGTPAVLHPATEGPPNRLTLARWLVDPANPLVARVTVNRYWAEIFGRGIVATAEDFGIKGDLPTHPELLDWLAVEFMDNGWSTKHILRTIVLSAAYRQSSAASENLLERDDKNLLLARGPRFRMDAEMIRDNALSLSGLISLKQFGPSVRPYQPEGLWAKVGGTAYDYVVSPGEDRYRRGLYVVIKRSAPYPSFTNFDAPGRISCSLTRSRTNTPLQALTLLNDPVYVEAAWGLARRIVTDVPQNDLDARLRYGFQICTARVPSDAELNVLKRLYQEQAGDLSGRTDDVRAITDRGPVPAGLTPEEFAAWQTIATTLLNLHETITKG